MQPVAFLQARLATRAPVAAASFVSLIIHAAPASAAEEHVARIPTAAAVSAVTAPAQTTHVVAQIPRSVMTTPLSQLTTACTRKADAPPAIMLPITAAITERRSSLMPLKKAST